MLRRAARMAVRLVAVVVPHAGHVYSGPTAGFAYASIDPAVVERVVLLGPAHYVPVDGIGLSTATAWRTPLGDVELDADVADDLRRRFDTVIPADHAHAPEHSLEVQLPFLQRVLARRLDAGPADRRRRPARRRGGRDHVVRRPPPHARRGLDRPLALPGLLLGDRPGRPDHPVDRAPAPGLDRHLRRVRALPPARAAHRCRSPGLVRPAARRPQLRRHRGGPRSGRRVRGVRGDHGASPGRAEARGARSSEATGPGSAVLDRGRRGGADPRGARSRAYPVGSRSDDVRSDLARVACDPPHARARDHPGGAVDPATAPVRRRRRGPPPTPSCASLERPSSPCGPRAATSWAASARCRRASRSSPTSPSTRSTRRSAIRGSRP